MSASPWVPRPRYLSLGTSAYSCIPGFLVASCSRVQSLKCCNALIHAQAHNHSCLHDHISSVQHMFIIPNVLIVISNISIDKMTDTMCCMLLHRIFMFRNLINVINDFFRKLFFLHVYIDSMVELLMPPISISSSSNRNWI